MIYPGEKIWLELVQQDNNGNFSVIENPTWKVGELQTQTSKLELQVKEYMSQVIVNKDDLLGESFIVNLGIKKTDNQEKTNIIQDLDLDLSNLDEDKRDNRREMFFTALGHVKEKNQGLYDRFTTCMVALKCLIVPGTNSNIPKIPGGILNGKADPAIVVTSSYSLLGLRYTNVDLDGKVMTNSCKLVKKLDASELEQIQIAAKKKVVTELFDEIYNRIAEDQSNKTVAETLKGQVLKGELDENFLKTIEYEIKEAEASQFITIGRSQTYLYLNDDALAGDPVLFDRTLAHELKHIEFALLNVYKKLKWLVIRDKSGNEANFDLGDDLGKNGHCSAGAGHEKYNPENKDVCDEENNY